MSIYKRAGSPFWWYEFEVGGHRFRGSTQTAVEKEAKRVEKHAREGAKAEAAARALALQRPPMTLNDAALRYYDECSRHFACAADDSYQFVNLVEGVGGETLLSQIDNNRLTQYVARRRGATSRRGKPLAASSINAEIKLLRQMMRRARRLWKVDVGEDLPDWGELRLHEPAERVRELSEDEEDALFVNLREDFHPMVDFALRTGIRLGNVIRLTWKQVEYDGRVISLKLKSRQPGGRPHTVPLTRELVLFLEQQCKGHHPIYVFTYVCKKSRRARQQGERYPFTTWGWRKAWRAALVAAGLRTFASMTPGIPPLAGRCALPATSSW